MLLKKTLSEKYTFLKHIFDRNTLFSGQDGSKRVLLREEMEEWEERGPRAEDVASK